MRQKLIDRRREILRMHFCGIATTTIAEQLAPKYKVSPRTIESDFTNRESWMPLILGDPDGEPFIIQLLEEIHQLRQRGWQLIVTREVTPNAKVGALSVLFASISHEVELLQSLGKAPKVPERLQQEIVGVQKIIFENVTDDERSCLNRAASILDKKLAGAKSKRESNNLH